MSEEKDESHGMLYAIGVVLGVGVGAAFGVAIGDLGTGIWIGAVIGTGLAMLASYLQR